MDQTHLSRFLSGLILKTQFDFCVGCDVIVPVPLHWSRLMKRKYNQSAFIARDIAKKTGKVYAPTAIIRYKKTKSQGHLSPKLREKNIKNAFTANPKIDVLGKKILLVDDVYTTGITANECAKVLVKAGASGVYVITLARVVKG
jgi:ComF family protein